MYGPWGKGAMNVEWTVCSKFYICQFVERFGIFKLGVD